jgi:hypothetical protein
MWEYGLYRAGLGQGQVEGTCECGNVEGTCECGNEQSCCTKCVEFLSSCEPVSFSRRTLLSEGSK